MARILSFHAFIMEIEKPRIFYRGDSPDPSETRRIKTGDNDWDNHFFVSSSKDSAKMYGDKISKYKATPDAKILYHGTKEYNTMAKGLKHKSLLDHSSEVARRAKSSGYHAVHFQRQGDVGTAVFDKSKFQKTDPDDNGFG